jgi:hypothetical protein
MLAERVLDGESCAAAVLTSVTQQVQAMKVRSGITPGLAVILVSGRSCVGAWRAVQPRFALFICVCQGAIRVCITCFLLQFAATMYFFKIRLERSLIL